jgi:hypothetical protein
MPTYDPSTPIGQVRLRIPDKDLQAPLFEGTELQALLDANKGNPLLAAADALEILAGDPQRIHQYRRGGISQAAASTEAILLRAARLRAQALGGFGVGTIERSDFW